MYVGVNLKYKNDNDTDSHDFKIKTLNEILSYAYKINIDNKNDLYLLRSGWNAPDDIDGKITFKSHRKLMLGEQVKVKITNAFV